MEEHKQKKFYASCGDINKIYSQKNYERFYLKKPILGLLKYNKPVIVTGTVEINPYDNYYTFSNIKPYYPKYEKQLIPLCGHINMLKDDVNVYVDFTQIPYRNELFVLICKPYIYYDKDNESRGGLVLTNSLNINPIMFYEEALENLKNISSKKYVDFYEYYNGYFLGISAAKVTMVKREQKMHSKYIRKQQKKYNKLHYPFLY